MSRFNLSEWALRNRGLVVYFMVLFGVIGLWSYGQLGQSEDPPFTFRMMVVRTYWPGASAEEVDRQVTHRIEEKLQEHERLDYLRSYSRPGESQVFFIARDDLPPVHMPDTLYQVRKKVGDMKHLLPPGTIGPFFNDEFGDTFGNIYALTGKDFSYAELKVYADDIRDRLLRIKDVAKVELVGVQDEKIEVRIDNIKRGQLGVPAQLILDTLGQMNSVHPAGFFEVAGERIYLRTSGAFRSEDDIRNAPLTYGGRTIRVGDVADVHRGYADPEQPHVRFKGEPALAIAVSMEKGGHIIHLGEALDAEFAAIEAELPLGLKLSRVADQPRAVRRGVKEFVRSLAEAVVIVLAVSFISLGLRTGLVVALSIPLVLAMTFAAMRFFDIDLHKISLGALVLSLGLLVDDAIIAVEMMAVKMEQGWDRIKAASFAYSTTAFPMLTGTLVTAAGFLPIATAKSGTGEYTRSIFEVVTLALLISWVAAVIFVPYLGYKLLPQSPHAGAAGSHDPYQTRFYRRFRGVVEWCVDRRGLVIGATIAAFVAAAVLFRFVPQQFFPSSTRVELMVDLKLPEGSSLAASDEATQRMEKILAGLDGLENYVAYIGSGSPRFILPLDQQLPAASFAQFVLTADSIEDRERIRSHLIALAPEAFPDVRIRVLRLEAGPPVGYPVQFRVSGKDHKVLQAIADRMMAAVRANPSVSNVHKDWDEPSKTVRLVMDQDRMAALGVSPESVANYMQSALGGGRVTWLRDADKQVEVVFRGPPGEREQLSLLESTAIPRADGSNIALNQIARLEYGFEPGIIWRRFHLPTVSVRADVYGTVQASAVTAQILKALEPIKAELPPGYTMHTGGTVEESAKGSGSINKGMPLFAVVVLTVLMFQLRSFSRVLLVVLTAPLGIIGVTVSMLLFQQPFGFVAMLGTIALSGMIMRNSVILVDQIDHDIAHGSPPQRAVVDATVRRLRPIALTAAAAVLAMVPLSRSVFFGPMAVAIMGGLVAATLLTLLFLPALYAAWFKVPRGARAPSAFPSPLAGEGGA
ncbi:MAG TPA: efflux RND transporter permease subunit [Solimonas sp.]|nr:efflux RND transporter permease subunit [Solimonas sp.]